MTLREEMGQEDLRFRAAIQDAANRLEAKEFEVVFRELSEESKRKQRQLFDQYLPHRRPSPENGEPVFPISFPAPSNDVSATPQ